MDNFNCTYKMTSWAPLGIQYMPGLRRELGFYFIRLSDFEFWE